MRTYSDEYNQVVRAARNTARNFGHNYIDTEHLLASMVATPNSEAAKLIHNVLNLTSTDVVERLVDFLPSQRQAGDEPPRDIYWNAAAKRGREYALRIAIDYDSPEVTSLHLLAGVTQVAYCRALEALSQLGVTAVEAQGVALNAIRLASIRNHELTPR